MNVFILNTGRCGSVTFIRACRHITNYTAGHETQSNRVGEAHFRYPENHIEADNRLAWFLGRLDRAYGDHAFYVHLKRDPQATARSYVRRYGGGIIRTYRRSILMGRPDNRDPMAVSLDLVDTLTSNIELFLRDKSRVIEVSLEDARRDFERFFHAIGAEGDLQAALSEWDASHNAHGQWKLPVKLARIARRWRSRRAHQGQDYNRTVPSTSGPAMKQPTNSELKQRERQSWAAVAAGWKRRDDVLSRGAAPVTERMLALAGILSGRHVLDIASGTGEPAIAAAHRVGESGRVVGTDLAEEMLAVAREKAAAAGLAWLEFHCLDGEKLDFPAESFDAATCRWGLMFMPEPTACLQRVHRLLRKEGRIVLACWSAPDRNPFVGLLIEILARYMEVPPPLPGRPGIFSLADPARLRGTIEAAGFRDVELEELEIDVIEVTDGREYWETMSDLAAPVMTLVGQLDRAARARYVREVIETADRLRDADRLRMRGTTWLAAAVK